MQADGITFFQRFQKDVLTGRKMTIIRGAAESHFKPDDILRVGRYEDGGYFYTIAVTTISTVTLDTLTEQHAQQENVTLEQLRRAIREVYPAGDRFYVVKFKRL